MSIKSRIFVVNFLLLLIAATPLSIFPLFQITQTASFPTPAELECSPPFGELESGGPPKDGIPAIDDPKFVNAESFEGSQDDLVLGIVIDGQARAYPHDILNWHEIVNDEINGEHFSVTFCPLTGSGILYFTSSVGSSTFGTTGYLWENNLVMYDRKSDTWWSQMYNLGICQGKYFDESLEMGAIIETTWSKWQAIYPETVVLSRDTGYRKDYDRTAYPGYTTSSSIMFPSSFDGNLEPYNLYHEKEMVLLLEVNNEKQLYPHSELAKVPVLNTLQAEVPITIVYAGDHLAVPFLATLSDGTELVFSQVDLNTEQSNSFETLLFQDQSGSVWNINGTAISGSYKGEQLKQIPAYNAYWFAVTTMFPNAYINIGLNPDNSNETGTQTWILTSYNPVTNDNEGNSGEGDTIPGWLFLSISSLPVVLIAMKYKKKRKER